MSRYVIRDDKKYEVVVGWDNPLSTYFAQVYDNEAFVKAVAVDPDADYIMRLWVGGSPKEIDSLRKLRELVHPYAIIDDAMRNQLENDKLNATPPSPLQQAMLKILENGDEV